MLIQQTPTREPPLYPCLSTSSSPRTEAGVQSHCREDVARLGQHQPPLYITGTHHESSNNFCEKHDFETFFSLFCNFWGHFDDLRRFSHSHGKPQAKQLPPDPQKPRPESKTPPFDDTLKFEIGRKSSSMMKSFFSNIRF